MTTVRIFFEKRGEAAYISLLDLQRVFHRLLKISGLPVWYTQGFNPHIYLSFSCPLSLGQESLCESCEVKTEQEAIDGTAWKNALQPLMPRGITITKVAVAVEKVGEISTAAYRISMPASAAPVLDAYNRGHQENKTRAENVGPQSLSASRGLRSAGRPAAFFPSSALWLRRSPQPQSVFVDGVSPFTRGRTGLAV